ncbi:hypothetical protein BDV18DRAFT_89467 [Aspergillus unguis]
MSDDEEYYDEFDDDGIFWVEEADPTAADDLAAGATYDPTFHDDPSLETADLYSDWDELTDDYYDEDPTAVRRLRAMGLWPIADPVPTDDAPPAKRKKTSNNYPTDISSFQGIAWKHPEDETDFVQVYAPGEGEKVSLLKNWREVFRDAKPAIGRLRGRIPPATLKGSDLTSISREQSESDLDVPSLVEDICEDEMVSSDTQDGLAAKVSSVQAAVDQPSEFPVHPKKSGHGKQNGSLGPINGVTTEPSDEKKPKEPTSAASRRGRKRKASISVDEQPEQSEKSTAETQPKAKRAATAKASQTTKQPASSGTVRRSARHKN